jgi:hypothetical protein
MHFRFAGPRPAVNLLAIAPSRTTASSLNLRRATSVPPVAINRTSSATHRPLLNEAVNAPQRHTASAEIPIAFDAPHCPTFCGFLPWRFADAGPAMRRATCANLHRSGQQTTKRRPATLTPPVVQTLRLQEGQQIGVDRFRLRGRHAMREALIGLQRAVL